jgi:hypothetical protein
MTHWEPTERAEAIARALTVGAIKASKETGIPRRTITAWISGAHPAPELAALVLSSREQVAAQLWQTIEVGTAEVLRRMSDPKARLGDVARSLEIAVNAHALLSGGPTSRIESTGGMDYLQRAEMARYVESLLAALDAGAVDEVEAVVMQTVGYVRDIDRLVDSGEASDDVEAGRLILERARTSG